MARTVLPRDIETLLRDLSDGALAFTRREAAVRLGQVCHSDERIVCALMVASMVDGQRDVRDAATESLSAAAHRAILERSPELATKAAEIVAQQARALANRMRCGDENIMEEYRRRWERGRAWGLLSLGGFVGFVVLAAIGLRWPALASLLLLVIGMAALARWSWTDWRCPVCDTPVGRWGAVGPPLFCLHCGARLR